MSGSAKNGKIPLMRPAMADREELEPYLSRIWDSRYVTNGGPICAEFEASLCRHLGVEHICLFANGTLALLLALKALDLEGEVITTPFTSVATIQAIYWNNLRPVFVDINPADLTIPPNLIEAAVTSGTSAILPVHVFGTPCDVKGIGEVATRYNLKTVYDAAPCFGVRHNGIPVTLFGDLAVLSFHATKVFNCIEGGVIICHDKATKEYIDALKGFRVDRALANKCLGFNAMMNEIQAAIGIVQLRHVDENIRMRKEATQRYMERLEGIAGIRTFPDKQGVESNYTYLPVIIDPGDFGTGRDELAGYLKERGIITRKYFHPLACDFPEFNLYKTGDLPVAKEISDGILCLPLYHDMIPDVIELVAGTIRELAQKCSAQK